MAQTDFFKLPYKNSLLEIFSDLIVVYYRKTEGIPNSFHLFRVSEVVLSIKNDSNDFFQTRCISFFLDAFSNVLIVHYRIIDGSTSYFNLMQGQ